MTVEGKARLAFVLDEFNPALMLLCLGGNDFLRHQNESDTAENLRAMETKGLNRIRPINHENCI